jgi:hypothetical protein
MKQRGIFWSVILLSALLTLPALAQSSSSYRVEESVFNYGGHPSQGTAPASVNYRISSGSIGENMVATSLASASYGIDSGFGSAYRPPGVIMDLRFISDDVLQWTAHRAAGSYNLYRDDLSGIGGYGSCFQPGLSSPSASDTEAPLSGAGFFYLATVRNRLHEEGGKGWDSSGVMRLGTWCP